MLLLTISLSIGLNCCAQGFSVDTNIVFFQGHPDSLEIKNGTQVQNLSGQFLDMAWQRTAQLLPSGWTAAVCDGAACRPPSVDFALYELDTNWNAFQNRMWMYYYPDSSAGTGTTTLQLWDVDGQFDTLTINYECTATYSVGVPSYSIEQLSVFPNPTLGNIRVRRSSVDHRAWQIFNHQGTILMAGSFNALDDAINLDGLPNGSYLLRSDSLTYRFVKH